MLANYIRDLVYPPHCIGCGNAGVWICPRCRNLRLMRAPPECIVCRKVSNGYRTHEHCLSGTGIRQAIICWRYNDFAKDAVKSLKYRVHYGIASELADLAMETVKHHLPKKGVLIPVPTTPTRIRERGFNQSEIIAQEICRQAQAATKSSSLTVRTILQKRPRGESQSGKSRAERLKADRGDFHFDTRGTIPPLNHAMILIDDVCTTGTTLHHCASVLREHGYADIVAIALFRGKPRYSRERSQIPQELQDEHEPPHDV